MDNWSVEEIEFYLKENFYPGLEKLKSAKKEQELRRQEHDQREREHLKLEIQRIEAETARFKAEKRLVEARRESGLVDATERRKRGTGVLATEGKIAGGSGSPARAKPKLAAEGNPIDYRW